MEGVDSFIFADDTALIKSGVNFDHTLKIMQQALDNLYQWSVAWGFKISESKTTAVLFKIHQQPITLNNVLTINKKPILVGKIFKFLGVVYDTNNNFDSHINQIAKRAQPRLNLMKMLSGKHWGSSKSTQLLLYKSLIRPILMYGSIAFGGACQTALRKLDSIQYKALLIATSGMRGTRGDALIVHCGELPLNLYREELLIKFRLKSLTTNNNAITNIFVDRQTGRLCKNKKNLKALSDTFMSAHPTLEIEPRVVSLYPPWICDNHTANTSLKNIILKNMEPTLARSVCLELIDSSSDPIQVFTDASVNTANRTGIGIFIKNKLDKTQQKLSLRLSNGISIDSAELLAILYGLKECYKYSLPVSLYSDSLHSIELFESRAISSTNNILNKINTLLKTFTCPVNLYWIPSHIGITGNDIADGLAMQATSRSITDIAVRPNLNEAYQLVHSYINKIHHEKWLLSKSVYSSICRLPDRKIKYTNPFKKRETVISRLQLGQCQLNFYLFKMTLHPDGLCSSCACQETIEHYLIHCNNVVASKIKEYAILKNIKLNLVTILTSPEFQDIILKYNTRPI
jgi:ribonuclease HI